MGFLSNKSLFFLLFIAFSLLSGCSFKDKSVKIHDFDSIQEFRLSNKNGLIVKLSNYGATITSILVPDKNGRLADVVLGYNNVEGYINALRRPYFGATIGRSANRIAKGSFTLNGNVYTLAVNNGSNHNHGGLFGFDKVIWEARIIGESVEMSRVSLNGEEGYPGNLVVKVLFSLNDANELKITYNASTDQATPVNLCNHSYFNLKGEGEGSIYSHQLWVNAHKITALDEQQIPTGKFIDVQGTPFDFKQAKEIGKDINQDHPLLKLCKGYDQNWVLDKADQGLSLAATLYEAQSGRFLEVFTTEPGLQVYTANYLNGSLRGKSGKSYEKHGAVCLETQHFPDAPNQPLFPTTILRPTEVYESSTIFRFSIK